MSVEERKEQSKKGVKLGSEEVNGIKFESRPESEVTGSGSHKAQRHRHLCGMEGTMGLSSWS
jgi:hypothetical protein